jgi:hypothetical protein
MTAPRFYQLSGTSWVVDLPISKTWCVPTTSQSDHAFIQSISECVVECPWPNAPNSWWSYFSTSFCLQIYDYINVQYIHNAAFVGACPPSVLTQARVLANYHESAIFSSPTMNSINNSPSFLVRLMPRTESLRSILAYIVAGQALLPRILDALTQIANSSNPLKFESMSLSYKPFLSLFAMMNISESNPDLSGMSAHYLRILLSL